MPAVSIILPVYNASKYLSACINSLLSQTLSDFELIIINDGSTDNSEAIIRQYNDNRIRLINNPGNKGLIYSLNLGIEEAKGNYIARMDADDICLPQRLEKQKALLDQEINIALTACPVQFIDENGNSIAESWKDDEENLGAAQIRKQMTKDNCIAHPSIMARASVLKQYRYPLNQKYTEDYALWLQLLSDGYLFEKVKEKLLLYRVHSSSITLQHHRKKNVFWLNYNTKRKFLATRLAKFRFSFFDVEVLIQMKFDFIKAVAKSIKQKFRN